MHVYESRAGCKVFFNYSCEIQHVKQVKIYLMFLAANASDNILLSKMFVADCIEKQEMGENYAQQTIFLQELPWLITKGES